MANGQYQGGANADPTYDPYDDEVAYEYLEPEPRPRISTSSKIFGLILVLVAVFAVPAGYGYINAQFAPRTVTPGKQITVTVVKGDTAASVGDKLEELGAVAKSYDFVAEAIKTGKAASIQAGEYPMTTGISPAEILDMLTTPREAVPTFKVLIPEGLTVDRVFERIAKAEGSHISVDQLKAAQAQVAIPTWVPKQSIPKGGNPLEGLLWPATYDFRQDATPVQILQLLVDNTSQRVAEIGPAKRGNLDPYQTLVLASLIEREARVPEERPIISSVIHNRLQKPMRLQIDATVVYGIMAATGQYKPRLLLKDYDFVSPWSTYTNDGLPPTPISNVGKASLEAAANPADTPYFYYVVNDLEKGTHAFAETAEQHQANIANRPKPAPGK